MRLFKESRGKPSFISSTPELSLFTMGLVHIILFASVCSCFVSGELRRPRKRDEGILTIVGGKKMRPYSWPFLVSVNRKGRRHHCGGAILNSEFVLSAAHCFYRDGANFAVVAGEHNLKKDEGPEQIRKVSNIILHPEYNDSTMENDIALIKLVEPLDLSVSEVSAIDLNTNSGFPRDRQRCMVAGWGSLSSGGVYPKVPNEVTVNVINNKKCNKAPKYSGSIFDSSICAGTKKGGKDSCQGDSGGPFVCTKGKKGKVVHVGIVSWGIGCASAKHPGVYTRTSSFASWITDTMAAN